MADTYEQNLGQKSSLGTSDYIRVVGTDNVSYKQLVSDVAKKIIENYTGSSLAGSSQSVKSALDALNSKTSFTIRYVTFNYELAAGGNTNTNLKALIDSDLPSGKTVRGIVGVSSGNVGIIVNNAYYSSSNYSLQLFNVGSSTRNGYATIYYLCS